MYTPFVYFGSEQKIFLQVLRNLCETCRLPLPWQHADLFHLGQLHTDLFHTRAGQSPPPPCMHGTKCGVQDRAAKLRNVTRAHLTTGQEQAVPIYHPGTLYRQ